MATTTVLYISYDGMTDTLGQSQVIPYLTSLAENGYDIHILSAEKPKQYEQRNVLIINILHRAGIEWHPIFYTKKPPVLSTLKDMRWMRKMADKLQRKFGFAIVHCRSYVPAFIGLHLKRRYGVKFLFDMRGFYADERVDGMLWPQSNALYRAVYRYFKRHEHDFFRYADYTVSLTSAGRDIIHQMQGLENIPIEVIPCCADLQLFDYQRVSDELVVAGRRKLGILPDDFVVGYLGSIGTWYMADEMMSFFCVLRAAYPNARFLFITKEPAERLYGLADRCGVARSDIIVQPADREQVPDFLALTHLALFFIKPVFSKKASSPTKLAEILGMGIPVVCNANVGDLDSYFATNDLGALVHGFTPSDYEGVVRRIPQLLRLRKAALRQFAVENLSLNVGAARYAAIYKILEK